MACPEGLEPPTYSLEGCCSIQLSYGQSLVPAAIVACRCSVLLQRRRQQVERGRSAIALAVIGGHGMQKIDLAACRSLGFE